MAVEGKDVVKRGYMTQCTSISEAASRSRLTESFLRKLTGHKLWYVLRSTSVRGRARLEFYKDEKLANDLTCLKGFIPLTDMTNAYVKDGESKKLLIECGHTAHVFKCSSMADAEDWLAALMGETLEKPPEQPAGSPRVSNLQKRATWGSTPTITEEKTAKFIVTVDRQPKLNFTGECELVVTEGEIYLKDLKSKQYIESWPLNLIRQYGHGNDHFVLEAGRRCTTGEGTFKFMTKGNQAAKIYQIVHTNSENWVTTGLTPPSTPPIRKSQTKSPLELPHIRINTRAKPNTNGPYASLNASTIDEPRHYEQRITASATAKAVKPPPSGYMALQTNREDSKAASDGHYMHKV